MITYDKNNRLTAVSHPNDSNPVAGATYYFDYDAVGRMYRMTDERGQTTWNFDELNRPTQMAAPQGVVKYAYDDDNRKVRRSIGNRAPWTYSYDAAGRLSSLQTPWNTATGFAYDSANRLILQNNGNGTISSYNYDTQSRVANVRHTTSTGAPIFYFSYAYDAGGRVLSRLDNDGHRINYSYDGENQLLSETRTDLYSLSYTYDHNGNRLTRQGTGTFGNWTENFTYESGDSDRLHGLTNSFGFSKTFAYDNNGNVIRTTVNGQPDASFQYDHENQLIGWQRQSDGLTNANRYNAMGLRVWRQDNAAAFNQLFDGAGVGSAMLYDGTSTYYTRGLDEWRYGQIKFTLGDALGSMGNLSDTSQTTSDPVAYEAFGTIIGRQGTNPTPFLFGGGAGYETELDSGLMLLGHRFYDANLGRFITRDPSGAGENWYAYANNNPTRSFNFQECRRNTVGIPLEYRRVIRVIKEAGRTDGRTAARWFLLDTAGRLC